MVSRFGISTEGEVSVNVECASGAQCEIMTRPFEEKLGTVATKEYKDSYYIEESSDQVTDVENEII
jgi:hypothetical protein